MIYILDNDGFIINSVLHMEQVPEGSKTTSVILPQGLYLPKFENDQWIEGKLVEELTSIVKVKQYKRLEEVFISKIAGLKRIAIDKPYMTNVDAINSQYESYEKFYENAKNGLYTEEKNAEIIAINEGVKQLLAPLLELVNTIRHIIEVLIEEESLDVDALLDSAEGITLELSEVTPEKVQQIKDTFGIV